MAWNGSGTFSLLYSWVARRDAGSPTNLIGATEMDAEFANIKTGLENCVTRDGQNAATAALPMGGYAHTGVGAATARTQYARVTEAQDGTLWKAASPGGNIDAMTGTLAPAITAYATNMIVTIIAPGTGPNTVTNPTINLNSIGTKTIKKHQGALVAGDYTAGDVLVLVYDGTYFELLNPKYAVTDTAHSNFTTDSTGGATDDLIPFIDTSDSSADNKVTVSDFFKNVYANVSAKAAPIAADSLTFADSAASGAVKRATFTELFTSLLGLFTAKSAPALADTFMLADSAASGAPKISTLQQLLNTITNLTADTSPDLYADHVLGYDASGAAAKKVPMLALGVALPGVTNLLITNGAGTTNISITFDQAVLVNSSGQGIAVLAGSYTLDGSVNAAVNRLDTGSLAANTEYHIWLIAKSDGTLPGSLLSLSPTAPTMPSGYTYKCRIGCFITGGASTFLRIRQVGKRSQYVVAAGTTVAAPVSFTTANNASKTALTAAGTTGSGNAGKVPSTAATIFLGMRTNSATGSYMEVYPNNDAGYSTGVVTTYAASRTGSSNDNTSCTVEMLLESASIYYIASNGTTTSGLVCLGWTDRVNAS